jgi:hypothetical protein
MAAKAFARRFCFFRQGFKSDGGIDQISQHKAGCVRVAVQEQGRCFVQQCFSEGRLTRHARAYSFFEVPDCPTVNPLAQLCANFLGLPRSRLSIGRKCAANLAGSASRERKLIAIVVGKTFAAL